MIPVARLAAILLPAIAVVGMDEQAPVPMRDVSIRGSAAKTRVLSSEREGRRLTLHVNMYER